MTRYRVFHKNTGETWEVDVNSEVEALEVVGWSSESCEISQVIDGEFAEIVPPKIATQISPPRNGSSHICPVCNVSLVEAVEKDELWWQCPSCDLLYHEWENQYYRSDEL